MTRTWSVLVWLFVAPGVIGVVRAEDEKAKLEHYPLVELETSLGSIIIELDDVRAPKSSANFLRYVHEGFYNGVIFHRVIRDYVIQAGKFDESMNPKTGLHDPIPCEWKNGLSNLRGTVAVARGAAVDSGQAQFFINLTDTPLLDQAWPAQGNAGYAVFGRVVQGMDVVDAISRVRTVLEHPAYSGERWVVPEEPVVIKKASVVPVSSARVEPAPIPGMRKIEIVTEEEFSAAKQATPPAAKTDETTPSDPKKE